MKDLFFDLGRSACSRSVYSLIDDENAMRLLIQNSRCAADVSASECVSYWNRGFYCGLVRKLESEKRRLGEMFYDMGVVACAKGFTSLKKDPEASSLISQIESLFDAGLCYSEGCMKLDTPEVSAHFWNEGFYKGIGTQVDIEKDHPFVLFDANVDGMVAQ